MLYVLYDYKLTFYPTHEYMYEGTHTYLIKTFLCGFIGYYKQRIPLDSLFPPWVHPSMIKWNIRKGKVLKTYTLTGT